MTCSSDYKISVNPSNKLAVFLHYYARWPFTKEYYFEPFTWTDEDDDIYTFMSLI